jgi:hypothetical protein
MLAAGFFFDMTENTDVQTALNSVFWTETPQTPQITFPKTPQTRLK